MKQLQRVVWTLLESKNPAHSLRPEVMEMVTILADSQAVWTASQENISYGETQTSNGLAISPTMAAMCTSDFIRTIKFIRGTYDAIIDVRKQFSDRPARILYVGCGPYAVLAIPLMAIFSSAEVEFTLLDAHYESVKSAESIVNTLGFADSVSGFEIMDAGLYYITPDQPPDIILMEIMRACLESEPQVAITRHLLKQAPHAILIPEEIHIDLILVDPTCEFNLGRGEQEVFPLQRDRIPVASVFIINHETVNSWSRNDSGRLPAATVQIPDSLEQRYQPMLFTTICIYNNHILRDYDSGLTCPRMLSIKDTIKSGDTIQFHYKLGNHPRLDGEKCM